MDDVKPFTAKEREGALRKNSRRSTQMDAEIPGGGMQPSLQNRKSHGVVVMK
jgi:hypothetical protein